MIAKANSLTCPNAKVQYALTRAVIGICMRSMLEEDISHVAQVIIVIFAQEFPSENYVTDYKGCTSVD